jgi:hypothetical protein
MNINTAAYSTVGLSFRKWVLHGSLDLACLYIYIYMCVCVCVCVCVGTESNAASNVPEMVLSGFAGNTEGRMLCLYRLTMARSVWTGLTNCLCKIVYKFSLARILILVEAF